MPEGGPTRDTSRGRPSSTFNLAICLSRSSFFVLFLLVHVSLVVAFRNPLDRADDESLAESSHNRDREDDVRTRRIPIKQLEHLGIQQDERDQRRGRANRWPHPDHE